MVSTYAPVTGPAHAPHPSPADQLPEGVTYMKDWGENLVAFGKYKMKKTYRAILTETNEEMVSYRGYVWSHRNCGSPALTDLAKYMERMGYTPDSDRNQGPLIPGSNIRRQK